MVDSSDHKQLAESLLAQVADATLGLSGHDFIVELAKKIPPIINMRYCFVVECANKEKTRLRTVAFVEGDKVLDNIEYNTAESACSMVVNGDAYYLPKGVKKFHQGTAGIEAYVAVPIISKLTGEMLGHIAASDPNPITDKKNRVAILKIFAAQLASELERMQSEKELEQKKYDIELYRQTLRNLHEAVFWVNANGNIIEVNEMATHMTGRSRDELLTMKVPELNPSEIVQDFPGFWKKLRKAKKITFEAKHLHKEGYFYEVEITGNYIEYNGQEFSCSIVRDIRKKKKEEDILRIISEGTAALTGMDYLQGLTKIVTEVLGVRYALVSECANEEKTRVRTISYVDRKQVLENIEYDLEGTPCQYVMNGKDYFCADELEKSFPGEKGIQSYIAVPINSPETGEVLGHIAALDSVPMTSDQNQSNILRIFAARAGAEMDRLAALKKLEELNKALDLSLKESDQRYKDLFEQAPIAYVHEGLDSKFIKANRAALKILGVKPEEVPFTYGSSLVPNTPDAQQRLNEAFASIGRGTDTSGIVLELRRKDTGAPIWIQWWSNPDVGGQFTRTMFIDITERVLMEQEQVRLKAQNQYLQEEIKYNHNFEDIVSTSKNFHKVLQQIEQVASTDATVLILGESGTGKELIARAIHNISKRNKRPLVKVNCATLPANLIESELFGHERGAFTGAMERKIGRFELADTGTIFLDEIGELPVELQAKLLRVLQEGEFERLGNPKTMKVNVRIIAATNRNLQTAIEKKEFREDLYYRLNVFPIITPPLRDRKEDIPLLLKHFIRKHETKMGRKITEVAPDVLNALHQYSWPGNVRELENLIERALILSKGSVLEYGDWIPAASGISTAHQTSSSKQTLEDVEKDHIIETLQRTNWKVSGEKGAAKILGLNATTLEARMKKLGITRPK
ncbi:sigma 54-interacting transcriptional regulator [Lacibacter sediminis]|uniref:Sigma 54-interacting transcriptional regulator n=1 Tax=Lacibacter sediminis TaxID=2760713 RepID=A0A7G5XDB8_9BACT|nr:sigma 54-interacting transcriptional regulator [Lacibacter sediminis]QNA43471.1 sigma 54-interacting transcriptional regulator [Lacibacter sediminis]